MPSPCLSCDFKDEDKNLPRCANCEKRIEYARKEFMIPPEALEADAAAREETSKITELRTGKPAKKRGPKPKLPKEVVIVDEKEGTRVKKRGWPKGRKRGSRPKPGEEKVVFGRPTTKKPHRCNTLTVQLRPLDRDPSVGELLTVLRDIAEREFRTVNQQALYFINYAIQKWKQDHDRGVSK